MSDKKYVIIPDTQIPFEDKKALKAVIRFIGDYQPDEVIHIGDVMDYPQPSRWNKDTKGEFEGSVFKDSEDAKERLIKPLRGVYDGPVGFLEGNHDLRPREYHAKYAPALAESDEFNFENLLDFKGFEITKLPEFYKFAPGWVATHGHRGNIPISRVGANTSLNAAKNKNCSVIMGHTHRLGQSSDTGGFAGDANRLVTGVEVGNLMDMRQAHYLKGGTANWQQGFGLVHVSGKHVQAHTISISDRFVVEGEVYKL